MNKLANALQFFYWLLLPMNPPLDPDLWGSFIWSNSKLVLGYYWFQATDSLGFWKSKALVISRN